MLETLQGDLGCNRRVEGLCSCVSYQLVHLEVRYVKLIWLYFTTFRRHVILQVLKLFSIREQNTKVWTVIYPHAKFEKAAPVTIEMFDQVKLTTSTKVSIITSPCDYRRCTDIEGQKSGLQQLNPRNDSSNTKTS